MIRFDHWPRPDQGTLFVVTGASGTGKTTLVRQALRRIPGLQFSVSVTTRSPRSGEVDGRDYHFITRESFDRLREENQFLEWAEVYGNCYGTLQAPVEEALKQGRSFLLEIDAQGAAQVRARLLEAVSIFILPPDIETLERRLRARSTDEESIIQRRMREARSQLSACSTFDYLVENEDLSSAHDQFQAILTAEMLRVKRHHHRLGWTRG